MGYRFLLRSLTVAMLESRRTGTHRQTVYKTLERGQTFLGKFENAKREALVQLETKLHELAFAGSV